MITDAGHVWQGDEAPNKHYQNMTAHMCSSTCSCQNTLLNAHQGTAVPDLWSKTLLAPAVQHQQLTCRRRRDELGHPEQTHQNQKTGIQDTTDCQSQKMMWNWTSEGRREQTRLATETPLTLADSQCKRPAGLKAPERTIGQSTGARLRPCGG